MTEQFSAESGSPLDEDKKSFFSVFKRWPEIKESFSFVEKVLFYIFSVLLVITTFGLLVVLNNKLLVEVPAPGGTIVEGVIGTPSFINPVMEFSDADRDLTILTHSGLMRATPEGKLLPDLAESFTISDDGLTYTFTLKDTAIFHDNTPVTADDIVFTIESAQNPDIKSPKRANWEGVLAEVVDQRTVRFTLAQVYAPFLENTTIGILPKHRWEEVPTEQFFRTSYNVEPIGSGPFKVTDIQRDNAGVPTRYTLTRFDEYTLGKPHLERVEIRFYPNEEELLGALGRGAVQNVNSISPERLVDIEKTDKTIHTTSLPRVFGVFFNQDKASIFTSKSLREALSVGVNRDAVVQNVLSGYGTPATGPLPPELVKSLLGVNTETQETTTTNYEEARTLLEDAGWSKNEETGLLTKDIDDVETPLRFSLATSNVLELKRAAEVLRSEWKKIGVTVDLTFYETGTLNQEIIRPREYDALLFGQIIGRDLDPFAFWHSSQRDDPGLNVALYANIDADEALENIRVTFDQDELAKHYLNFEREIAADTPAVFLYAPEFVYITNDKLKGIVRGTITTPAERFLNVHNWHLFTQKVWPMFAQQ